MCAEGKRKAGRILKIILFGSHARNDWVDEALTGKGYVSDFDLLVIVNQADLTDLDLWDKADERLSLELYVLKTSRTPVNFIVHTLKEVNDALAKGTSFHMDLARDGIALYELNDSELHRPRPKEPADALAQAREHFETNFPPAMKRFEIAKFAISNRFTNEAAFDLHQTVEKLYNCALLVMTSYSPKRHNIAALRGMADKLDRRIVDVWPRESRKDRALFTKLRDAYVKSRYSKHYEIDLDELNWLVERIETLGQVIHMVCEEKIASLKRTAGEI